MKLPLVIAHRGGRRWAPENTMAAFRKSLELGADGIELDVHRCASGELVVIHDHDLGRTTNGVGLIKDVTYDELARLSAGAWFDEEMAFLGEQATAPAQKTKSDQSFKGERIPLLKDVLELVSGQVLLNIEIKNTPVEYPGIEEDLLELLENYGRIDTIIVSSFDHKVMQQLHNKAPHIQIAVLADALMIDLGEYAKKIGATYWHPYYGSIRRESVEEAHADGLKINAWTVNKMRDWSECARWGIDGIVTDDPENLKSFLNQIKSAQSAP